MIVVTHPTSVPKEIKIIHALFEEGMKLLHVRKPTFSEEEMKVYLSEIKVDFRPYLVLHNHHQLAHDSGVKRIHFTERHRIETKAIPERFSKPCPFIKSTATHSIPVFNALSPIYDYAFLSPVLPSISKENYLPKIDLLKEVKNRINFKTKMIALGGIQPENIRQIIHAGFDDVAVLGSIWNDNNAIKNFKLCQQIALSPLQ